MKKKGVEERGGGRDFTGIFHGVKKEKGSAPASYLAGRRKTREKKRTDLDSYTSRVQSRGGKKENEKKGGGGKGGNRFCPTPAAEANLSKEKKGGKRALKNKRHTGKPVRHCLSSIRLWKEKKKKKKKKKKKRREEKGNKRDRPALPRHEEKERKKKGNSKVKKEKKENSRS